MRTFDCDYCGETFPDTIDTPLIMQRSGPFRGERYCSKKCKREANAFVPSEGNCEAQQLGFSGLD